MKVNHKFTKFCFLVLSAVIFSTAVSGAIFETPLTSVGGGFADVIDTVNSLLFWEITTVLDLTLFIASWAGFYFATKPLLLELYGVILDNFPTSDRRNRWSTTEEGRPIGMKGLALTSSFVATQVIGQLLGPILMIGIGVLGLFVFFYSYFKGMNAFRSNFGNALSGNQGTTEIETEDLNLDERFNEVREEFSEMQEELRDEIEGEEDIKQKISRLRGEKREFNTAADELIQDERLPEDVRRDLEYLREEMDDDLQKEFSLASVLDEVVKEEEAEIQELNDVESLAEYIRSEFSHLVNLNNDLDQRIGSMERELQDIKEREQRDGVTEELRNEFEDFREKLRATRTEIREAVEEAREAREKAEEAMREIEEIDQQESQTKDEIEEAETEDEEIQSETEDEEQKYDAVAQKIQEYQKKAKQADREKFQRDMEEIHGTVEAEEEVANEEDKEVREAHDEMMKIDHEKEELKQIVERDNQKIAEVASELKNKTDELQKLEEEANDLKGLAERTEMEEEEFNENLMELIERLEWIRDSNDMDGNQKVRQTEEAIREIEKLRNKMPPEIKNREEGEYLKNQQGNIYRLTDEISNTISNTDAKERIKEVENKYFPPLLENN